MHKHTVGRLSAGSVTVTASQSKGLLITARVRHEALSFTDGGERPPPESADSGGNR